MSEQVEEQNAVVTLTYQRKEIEGGEKEGVDMKINATMTMPELAEFIVNCQLTLVQYTKEIAKKSSTFGHLYNSLMLSKMQEKSYTEVVAMDLENTKTGEKL